MNMLHNGITYIYKGSFCQECFNKNFLSHCYINSQNCIKILDLQNISLARHLIFQYGTLNSRRRISPSGRNYLIVCPFSLIHGLALKVRTSTERRPPHGAVFVFGARLGAEKAVWTRPVHKHLTRVLPTCIVFKFLRGDKINVNKVFLLGKYVFVLISARRFN